MYRVRQFFWALGARMNPASWVEVEAILTPPQMALFRRMPRYDQRHSLDVARSVRESEAVKALHKRCDDLAVIIGQITRQRDGLLSGLSEKDAEIEKLRGQLEGMELFAQDQQTDIEKLRGLLHEVSEQSRLTDMYQWENNLMQRVREALGDEP